MRNITDDIAASNYTSNITDLLSKDGIELLRELTQEDLEAAFGRGQEPEDEDNDKGYGVEWYFQAWTGEKVGIGFRYNEARLRGGSISEATAERFLGWVLGCINLA
tara:strand:- start:128 stop:445 length:318 start_codon:yes stop_codon:yes gene_type:complete